MNFWDIAYIVDCLRVNNIPDYKIFLLFPSGYNHQYCRDRPPYRQSCRSPRDTGYTLHQDYYSSLDMCWLGKPDSHRQNLLGTTYLYHTRQQSIALAQPQNPNQRCRSCTRQWRQISFSSLTPILQQKTTGNIQVVGGSQQLQRIAVFIQYIQDPSNPDWLENFSSHIAMLCSGCEATQQ